MKVFGIAMAGILLLLGSGSSPPAAQPGLFISKGSQADQRAMPRVGVVRERAVDVDWSQVPGANGRGELPRPGHELLLNLFDDVVVQARMERSERTERGMTWVGRLKGKLPGDVVIVIQDGVMAGSIVSPEGAYSIRYDGSSQVVEEIDRSTLPPEAEPLEPLLPPVPDAAADQAALLDDGSTIDVLVVYTPAARDSAGGTAGIQSRIQLGVTETNAAYENSGVLQRLRLVGALEVSYTESGDIGTDLNHLTYTDGVLDTVQTIRDTYKADLVSLITNTLGSAYCGMAWLMGGNNPSFAPYAYSVVEQTCISPNYSFGHELGHNMGLNHARTDPVGTGAYSYSYGYKDPSDYFRTMMAYDCPLSCPRILNFSNPNVLYAGRPTGIVDTAPDSAYNALSLNNTRFTVANWRIRTPKVTVVSPNGGEAFPTQSQQVVTWASSDLSPGAVVRVYSTDSSGSNPVFLADVGPGATSMIWNITVPAGNSTRIKVCSYRNGACEAEDLSDGPFSIVAPAGSPAQNDINGDGIPDILWHEQYSGYVYAWMMDRLKYVWGSFLSPDRVPDTQWQVRGFADFNRDGKNDLLWHHQGTGALYAWLMNGLNRIAGTYLPGDPVTDTQWQVVAVADFNGDGNMDLLWQHMTSGYLYVWIMDGLVHVTGQFLTPDHVGDTGWQVRGAGDFNGDGKPDILWQHMTSGDLYCWTMDGLTQKAAAYLNPSRVGDNGWQIRAIGDFNGDGKPDILWHHKGTGHLYVWIMDGLNQKVGSFVNPSRVADISWQVIVR